MRLCQRQRKRIVLQSRASIESIPRAVAVRAIKECLPICAVPQRQRFFVAEVVIGADYGLDCVLRIAATCIYRVAVFDLPKHDAVRFQFVERTAFDNRKQTGDFGFCIQFILLRRFRQL